MNNALFIFWQFLKRDYFVYRQRLATYFINYCLIYPVLFGFGIGYVQTHAYFGAGQAKLGTVVFIGHILIIVVVLANTLNIGLLFDLEQDRFIDYQITLLNPRLVLLERIFFTSLFVFALAIPFFPVAKLVLGNAFDTSNTCWPALFFILYLSSLCCSAYTQLCACVIESSRSLRSFWMRVNFGLITFGGIFIPYYICKQFSSVLAYFTLLDPLLYITEGLRRAILQDPVFLPIWLCALALLVFSALFTVASWHFFKKRIDHI